MGARTGNKKTNQFDYFLESEQGMMGDGGSGWAAKRVVGKKKHKKIPTGVCDFRRGKPKAGGRAQGQFESANLSHREP